MSKKEALPTELRPELGLSTSIFPLPRAEKIMPTYEQLEKLLKK